MLRGESHVLRAWLSILMDRVSVRLHKHPDSFVLLPHFAERDGGNGLEVLPFKDPADILRLWRGDPTSRNSVLLLASRQAWPQVSHTFTVVCFCFYCRLDPLPRDHWLFTTSDAQVSDRSLSWREVLYYHAFRQRAQGKPLKAWRQRVHEKQQDGVIFGPLP